jgi:cytochrome c
MKVKALRPIFLLCSLLFLFSAIIYSGCTESPDKKSSGDNNTSGDQTTSGSELSAKGKEMFYAVSTETGLKCADCHGDGSNIDVTLTQYFSSVNGVPKRTSTYHGMITGEEVKKTAGGSTICWERYLGYTDEMSPEQINALNAYFEEIATPNDPTEVIYETLALPKPDKDKFKLQRDEIMSLKGDAVNGETLFKNACASCHHSESKVKDIPNLQEYEGDGRGIAYNMRLGHDLMPFYREDKMSNQDIADISEFIMTKIVKK